MNEDQLLRELELEEEMIRRGRKRFMDGIKEAQDKGREGTTTYAQAILKRNVAALSGVIAHFQAQSMQGRAGRRHLAAQTLKGLEPDVIAFIALRTILDSFLEKPRLQGVAVRIGREIETEQRLTAFEKVAPDYFHGIQRNLKGRSDGRFRELMFKYGERNLGEFKHEKWSLEKCLHTGMKLIELAQETCNFFKPFAEYSQKKKGSIWVIVPLPRIEEWLNRHLETMGLLHPNYLPTIVPPKPWTGAYGGGYYSEKMIPLTLVKTRDKEYHALVDRKIENGELAEVLSAINALQNTAWSINKKVYEVAQQLWDYSDGGFAGMPSRERVPLPPCPKCGADMTPIVGMGQRHSCFDTLTEEELKVWKFQTAQSYERNQQLTSLKALFQKTLWVASLYLEEEALYFPYQMDFRGRIYAVPDALNPQGANLAKGLLQFAKGKPLGTMAAANWLAVHGANTYGYDKASMDERKAWVLQHQNEIVACAVDPYANKFWHDADNPWAFLAFCFEWHGFLEQGLEFVSHLPIALDGTCNGLQIYSLILRDKVGGQATNLLPSDRPQDIYGIVAEKVIVQLKHDAELPAIASDVMSEKGNLRYNKTACASWLLTQKLDRKMTKRQVMIVPYGGTRISCREYTEEWLKTLDVEAGNGHTMRQIADYLSEIIWHCIGNTIVKAFEAMDFLQKTATILNKADKPICWTAPSGFYVHQAYRQVPGHQVKTKLGDTLYYLSIEMEDQAFTAPLDTKGQRNAVAPNYVHSLDAAALVRTVSKTMDKGIYSFAMIHDSYGTLAADTETLAETLRDAFIDLFAGRESLLALWSREVLAGVAMETLAKDLPKTPNFGELDVKQVRQSRYFFA